MNSLELLEFSLTKHQNDYIFNSNGMRRDNLNSWLHSSNSDGRVKQFWRLWERLSQQIKRCHFSLHYLNGLNTRLNRNMKMWKWSLMLISHKLTQTGPKLSQTYSKFHPIFKGRNTITSILIIQVSFWCFFNCLNIFVCVTLCARINL